VSTADSIQADAFACSDPVGDGRQSARTGTPKDAERWRTHRGQARTRGIGWYRRDTETRGYPVGEDWYVVGVDCGGTTNAGTVLRSDGRFLVDRLIESPSRVLDGPVAAVAALEEALDAALDEAGIGREQVRVVGLDTPGPASATGVISSRGATNFSGPQWRGFDVRGALEHRLRLPVVYINDANAAAMYAHYAYFGSARALYSSVAAIVGTGLGGGLVEAGTVITGRSGMAGELGHVQIPLDGILEQDQPIPRCNCGLFGDVESLASLTGIRKNLLPYWLTRYPDHPLHRVPDEAERTYRVRTLAEEGDEMCLRIFRQQADAIAALFHIASNFTDPTAYVVGGGVVEATDEFRTWFIDRVGEHMNLREEQAEVAVVATVPDLDMAGSRGAALSALDSARTSAAT
jgi:predicted NBD/HSP70 family sugar kinase